MNEEELFCKLFPEYTVNGKPLSPYFDLFESGYEQAENRIEELENENAELRAKESFVGDQNRKLCEQQQKIEVLKAENAELKEQLESERDLPAIAYMQGAEKQKKKDEEQLTEAKELLERLLITSCNSDVLNLLPNCSEVLRVRVEAEQFLKGE